MRAVLTNAGTAGEIFPLLALAKELAEAGHEAVVALSPEYESWVRRTGVPYLPIGPPVQDVFNKLTLAATENPELFTCYEELSNLLEPLRSALPLAYQDLRRCALDADVLIAGHLQPVARMVHEVLGVPFVSLCATYMVPNTTPEAHRLATQQLVNPLRDELGLKPVQEPVATDAFSQQLHLFTLSQHVTPRHPNWLPHFQMTGYFSLPEEDWRPDEKLSDFMRQGEAPVTVALGSMVHDDPEALLTIILRAGEIAGRRLVVQRGRNRFSDLAPNPNVHLVDYVPHTWLFQRSACVVHHGGAGTTAAAFMAGVPAVIVPHILDQPFWAATAHKLGCAPSPLHSNDLSAPSLASLLLLTLNAPDYRQHAQTIAKLVNGEQGTRNARRLIEDLIQAG